MRLLFKWYFVFSGVVLHAIVLFLLLKIGGSVTSISNFALDVVARFLE